jgi:hypothetical protein
LGVHPSARWFLNEDLLTDALETDPEISNCSKILRLDVLSILLLVLWKLLCLFHLC